jgi:hypothetical protein
MRMHALPKASIGAALAVALLVACSDGDSAATGPGPNPGQQVLEDQFGLGFGRLFRASANSDPAEPQPSDLQPLSLVTDPLPVP